jgi:hypothetical protein
MWILPHCGAMGGTIAPLGSAPLPNATPQPVSEAGGGDLSSALADLGAAVAKLQAAVDALAGGMAVQGGGPAGTQGCTCDHGSTQAALTPPSKGADGGTKAQEKPQESRPDPAPSAGGVRERIVEAARAELKRGVTEDAGSDKDKAGRIREYRTAVTGPGENPDLAEPWCGRGAVRTRRKGRGLHGRDDQEVQG